ncbi:MAG TPA: PAS domain-containing protein [Sphingobacteriaceae bacterium]
MTDTTATEDLQMALGGAVTERVHAMLAYWDREEVCRYANRAYQEWFGRPEEELVNRISLEELLGHGAYQQYLPHLRGVLQGEEQVFERETSLPGESRPRYTVAHYYPDIREGSVQGFFAYIKDITDLKQVQIELKERKQQLRDSYEIVRKQNERLVHFTHLISHNLKTHAGNLTSLLNIIAGSECEEERAEMFGLLQELSGVFNENVGHLNEISTAHGAPGKKALQVYDFVEKTRDLLAINIQDTGATVINRVSPGLTVQYNPAFMESILLNLVTNALKYRHPDRPPIIEVCSTEDGAGSVIVSVRDNGRGIDLARHGDKLFGIYHTFHGNPDARGVGLFISRYQAEAMGGSILAESLPGEGSVFKIRIPAEETAPV